MPPLVAPGVVRFAVHGTYAGQPVVNIVDMLIDTTGAVTERSNAINQQARIIIDEWVKQICGWLVVDNYVAQELRWMDLDSADGEVGSRVLGETESFPAPGAGLQSAAPGNVAIRINKQTSGGRGTRQGRMYLVGLAENQTDSDVPNSMNAETITGANEKLSDFLEAINNDFNWPNALDWTSYLVVVHTIDRVYDGHTRVTALTVDPRLGSQVRRLR